MENKDAHLPHQCHYLHHVSHSPSSNIPSPHTVFANHGRGIFDSPLGSSILATGIPQIMAEFHSTNSELGSLVVSVYLLGFAVGPLVIAPLSELYGRTPLYHICNTAFAALTVGCAMGPTLNSEIALRFLQGAAGSAPLGLGGGTISDLIPQERRGKYMGIYALGPTLGPILGPVAGGFLTGAKGWRWLMWLLLMIVSALFFDC